MPPHHPPTANLRRSILPLVVGISLYVGLPVTAVAGGGPENVLLVVNRKSSDSLTIANHYIQLRQIPAGNVLTLSWDPESVVTNVDLFRKQILIPVLTTIEKRQLTRQIDYVVYSSDFPWAVGVKADVKATLDRMREKAGENSSRKVEWPKVLSPTGSINGLTYLWSPVLTRNASYMHLQSNSYVRLGVSEQKAAPTLAFESSQRFGPRGELLDNGGRQYMLSMMLGVTSGCGNTVEEVLSYLRRSARADGTHPKGTIYFVQNSDVRSQARHDGYPAAVEELQKLGAAAKVVSGKLPDRKNDVQGAMIGYAKFKWKTSGSTILPGAICENLTSYSGYMHKTNHQTPLSEFLRYGAAGASGTVAEPYVLKGVPQPKFPRPSIHVHYARGCTLAEAFYQSVAAPYQLLIVGDPLCRPWANIPRVTVEGIEPAATVSGRLTLKPSATVPGGSAVDRFRLFVDGWLRAECGPGESFEFDTAQLADGYHELRVVGIEAGLIRSQGRQILAFTTANRDRTITASLSPQGPVRLDTPLAVTASSPSSTEIWVMHNSRLLGKIQGSRGRMRIDPLQLGYGPVQLRVVGSTADGPMTYAWAKPLELTVERL